MALNVLTKDERKVLIRSGQDGTWSGPRAAKRLLVAWGSPAGGSSKWISDEASFARGGSAPDRSRARGRPAPATRRALDSLGADAAPPAKSGGPTHLDTSMERGRPVVLPTGTATRESRPPDPCDREGAGAGTPLASRFRPVPDVVHRPEPDGLASRRSDLAGRSGTDAGGRRPSDVTSARCLAASSGVTSPYRGRGSDRQ